MTRRVLVVDDEPDIREIAWLALHRVAHWDVLLADSGTQALRVAAAEQPDAILLDVMMPGMDGHETARQLGSDPRTARIPVVLLTAKSLRDEQSSLVGLNVTAVLHKPFNPMTLATQIADSLGWPQ